MIGSRISIQGDHPGLFGRVQCSHKDPYKRQPGGHREERSQRGEGDVIKEADTGEM